jgi:hypothetical protein
LMRERRAAGGRQREAKRQVQHVPVRLVSPVLRYASDSRKSTPQPSQQHP